MEDHNIYDQNHQFWVTFFIYLNITKCLSKLIFQHPVQQADLGRGVGPGEQNDGECKCPKSAQVVTSVARYISRVTDKSNSVTTLDPPPLAAPQPPDGIIHGHGLFKLKDVREQSEALLDQVWLARLSVPCPVPTAQACCAQARRAGTGTSVCVITTE